MSELTNTEKVEVLKSFVKEAFCIDGEIDAVLEAKKFDSYFRCNDSERGTILVAFEKDKQSA